MNTESHKLVIGIVGEKGSGKETCAKLIATCLPQKKVVHLRFSDLLADTLKLWDLPLTRHNHQQLAIVMNQGFGDGTLTRGISARIHAIEADVVVLDGVRWLSDAAMINSFQHHILLYVTADIRVRYERTKMRTGSGKVGETMASYENFLKEEQVKTELDIPKIAVDADAKIINNGSVEELKVQVENFCKEKTARA